MRIWTWISTKLWPFLEKHWEAVAIFALAIAGIYVGKRLFGPVVDSVLGLITGPSMDFTKIPGDNTHVMTSVNGVYQVVALPKDAKGNQVVIDGPNPVTAVFFRPGAPAMVQRLNDAATDRK